MPIWSVFCASTEQNRLIYRMKATTRQTYKAMANMMFALCFTGCGTSNQGLDEQKVNENFRKAIQDLQEGRNTTTQTTRKPDGSVKIVTWTPIPNE